MDICNLNIIIIFIILTIFLYLFYNNLNIKISLLLGIIIILLCLNLLINTNYFKKKEQFNIKELKGKIDNILTKDYKELVVESSCINVKKNDENYNHNVYSGICLDNNQLPPNF